MKRSPLILILLLAYLKGFTQKEFTVAEFKKLQWLQGSWKGMSGTEPFYEAWRLINDSVLANLAIEIKAGDTLVKESGALLLKGGKMTLGQSPTLWQATRLLENEIVLKNDTLRYSNTIIWLHTKDDHWVHDMTLEPVIDRKVEKWLRLRKQKEIKT